MNSAGGAAASRRALAALLLARPQVAGILRVQDALGEQHARAALIRAASGKFCGDGEPWTSDAAFGPLWACRKQQAQGGPPVPALLAGALVRVRAGGRYLLRRVEGVQGSGDSALLTLQVRNSKELPQWRCSQT